MEDEGSLREVPYQAREIPWERLQQMGVMGEALQICGKGERLADQQVIAALPACLTSWAVEEFETVRRKYIEKVPGEEAPIFETNRHFCEILQRAQELELIQKNARDVDQRRDKTTRADRVRFSHDDWEQDNVVRANFPNSHGPVEEKFAALQTSMGTVANRIDKLDATVARQGDATQQLMKSMNDNLTQLTAVMTQMPAVMTAAMAASMNDLKTVLVGVARGPRSSSSGQIPQTQPQQQPPQNTNNRFAPNKPFGHVSLNNPPPSRAKCYECKEVGHFARDCPKGTIKSDHLNWVQPELQ